MLRVEEGHIITIAYILRENDMRGALIEQITVDYPFVFLYGSGKLLTSFEDKLRQLCERDIFEFTIPTEQAYGVHEPSNVLDLPMDSFKVDGYLPEDLIAEGSTVKLTDDLGEEHHGRILKVKKEMVTVDFNHPMAGKNLYFKGVILNIRKASELEIRRQHPIEGDGIRN